MNLVLKLGIEWLSWFLNVWSLFVFWFLCYFKGNFFIFFEGFEIIYGDCGEMGEEIFVVIVWGDEVVVFGVIELFYSICCYIVFFLKM